MKCGNLCPKKARKCWWLILQASDKLGESHVSYFCTKKCLESRKSEVMKVLKPGKSYLVTREPKIPKHAS